MKWYQIFWASWVVIALVVELTVLIFRIEGATLSEQIWKLRDSGSGWFSLLMFFLAWMIYHFVRENVSPPDSPTPTPEFPVESSEAGQ